MSSLVKTPVLDVEADPKTWQDFYFLAPGLYTSGVYMCVLDRVLVPRVCCVCVCAHVLSHEDMIWQYLPTHLFLFQHDVLSRAVGQGST